MDPDLLVKDADPGIRIHTKMSRIPNTGLFFAGFFQLYLDFAFSRALNYHGQQLMSFLKDSDVCRVTDLKNVDYHLYQQVHSYLNFLLLLPITGHNIEKNKRKGPRF